MSKRKNTNVVSINGTEHDLNSFSDEQKSVINQIRLCQSKVAQIKSELNIVQVSMEAYTNALIKSVEEVKVDQAS
jgi:hypothetical protein